MDKLNQPLSGNEMPRFGGISTMMRLPYAKSDEDLKKLDAAYVGIPLDIGTSWRSGTRFGPRTIRNESVMIRPYNMATKAAPFESLNVADIGDIPINTYDLKKSLSIIEDYYNKLLSHNIIPLAIGGDHTITLAILRAMSKKYKDKIAIIHIDAHADTNEEMFGEKIAHGTTFRRAVEENLIDSKNTFQIGLRAQGYSHEDFEWGRKIGFTIFQAEDLWYKSLKPIISEIKSKIKDKFTYISFDIDSIDPSYAPGTGTPEIGGITSTQALEVIRECHGLNIIGCDLVEVSPPYDHGGITSLLAANLLYEMLCVLPNVKYY